MNVKGEMEAREAMCVASPCSSPPPMVKFGAAESIKYSPIVLLSESVGSELLQVDGFEEGIYSL